MRQSQRQYTVEDYFFVDVGSPIRHEYFDGEIYAMSGGTRVHARIAVNVIVALGAALRGTPCEPFGGDMRVKTPSGLYTYPDASVVCGKVEEIGTEERTTLVNPVVIVEVLSNSTRKYDRGEKFENYRSIASLREYLLIEQTQPSVELRQRTANGEWTSTTIDSLDQSVHLASIDVGVPLASIYERVEFRRS